MSESGTVRAPRVNPFFFPVKASDTTFANAQLDRVTALGIDEYTLDEDDLFELGRTAAMTKLTGESPEVPVTVEWCEFLDMRLWNLFYGMNHDNTTAFNVEDQAAASLCEGALVVHVLDETLTNVVRSFLLWKVVPTGGGISVRNNPTEPVACSISLSGNSMLLAFNTGGKILVDYLTASSSVLTLADAAVVERSDWPDDDDGSSTSTTLTGAPTGSVYHVTSASGFLIGQEVLIDDGSNNWETTKITDISGTDITVQDAPDGSYGTGDTFKRTLGFTPFVYGQTSGNWLVHCDDYRVVRAGSTTTIINIDGGSAIGATEVCVVAYLLASGAEQWTLNDTDAYAVKHTQCMLMVDDANDFSSPNEVNRAQSGDISWTHDREESNEVGSSEPVSKALNSTEVRLSVPAWMTDGTLWARLANKDPDTIVSLRHDNAPATNLAFRVFSKASRLDGDEKMCYKMLGMKRTGAQVSSNANEQGTKSFTITGTSLSIGTSMT